MCNTRSHLYSEFSPNRQAIKGDCWEPSVGSSVISCVIPGKDSLKSTHCNYHYIPLIFHKNITSWWVHEVWCEERKGGEVIPGRKGVGGSLRPGQTIPDTAPPPPTEAAHQGTRRPDKVTHRRWLRRTWPWKVRRYKLLPLVTIYCAEESTAHLWTTVQFCLQNWLRGL